LKWSVPKVSRHARRAECNGHVEDTKDRKIEALEAKVQRKDAVIAELMEEHVQLKKSLGEI